MKKISICIAVFNKFSFTQKSLEDLSFLSNEHEIIVYDNGSTDETQSKLQTSKEIIYIRSEVNKGFAFGANQTYKASSGSTIIWLNNDIRVTNNKSNWTKDLDIAATDGYIACIQMGLLDSNFNFVRESNEYIDDKYSYASGWCVAISKENAKKLDISGDGEIFSEEYGLAYFEDTDLSFRAKKMHMPFKIIDSPLVHFGKTTSKQLNTYELYTKAREIFIKKWKDK